MSGDTGVCTLQLNDLPPENQALFASPAAKARELAQSLVHYRDAFHRFGPHWSPLVADFERLRQEAESLAASLSERIL
jgi:hypothetical protein